MPRKLYNPHQYITYYGPVADQSKSVIVTVIFSEAIAPGSSRCKCRLGFLNRSLTELLHSQIQRLEELQHVFIQMPLPRQTIFPRTRSRHHLDDIDAKRTLPMHESARQKMCKLQSFNSICIGLSTTWPKSCNACYGTNKACISTAFANRSS